MNEGSNTKLRLVCLFVSTLTCASVWSLELPPTILSDLGSPEFRVREEAEAKMLEWGRSRREASMKVLLVKVHTAQDPEVRERCLEILKKLVNDEYLKDGEGFIGISMLDEIANVPGDPNPRQVIRIRQIIKGTAAEKAGLQLNDLIAGLDGDVWRAAPAADTFSQLIKKKKPGTKVVLKVIRDQKLKTFDLVLGKRLVSADLLMMGGSGIDGQAAEKAAEENYFKRWLDKHDSE